MKRPHFWNCRFLLCIAFVLFALAATAQSQYFVSTSGSDSNSGSPTSPWRTIQHGLNSAPLGGGGSTITVGCGTYAENVSTTRSGSASQPITLISANPETYCAKIVGQGADSVVHLGSGSVAHGGNYIRVEGFEITGPNSNQGVAMQGNHDAVVRNKIHDIQRTGSCSDGGGDGISSQNNGETYPGGPSDPGGINFNLADGNIIYLIGSWPTLCNYTHGIYFSTSYNTAQNNVVFHAAANGIITYHYVTNNKFLNNTTFENVASGIFISAKDINEDFTIIANNISVNNGNYGIRATAFSPSGHTEGPNNVFTNNLTFGNRGGDYLLDGPSRGTPVNSITSGSNSTTFVQYTGDQNGDYHLKTGSSAIGVGSISNAPPDDLEGLPRLSSAVDLGAFGFATGSTPTAPAAPTGLTAQVQ